MSAVLVAVLVALAGAGGAAAGGKAPLHKYSRASLPTMADEERCRGRGRWYDKESDCECFYPYVGDDCGDKDTSLPEREYSGVIRYLTSPLAKDVEDMLKSIDSVEEMFNAKHHYPYLIFHDGLSAKQKELIRSHAKHPMWFARSVFFDHIPSTAHRSKFWRNCRPHELKNGKCEPPVGYLKMCRWSSGPLYQEPAMLPFDLELHLDTDSTLTTPVERDIFAVMHEGGYSFGYTHMRLEGSHVSKGFWKATQQFMNVTGVDVERKPLMRKYIPPTMEYSRLIYMADYEVTRPDFFGDPDGPAMKYFEALDKTDGFFYGRWGNNLARTLAVWMFLDESEVYQYHDIGYAHQGQHICPLPEGASDFYDAREKQLYPKKTTCHNPDAFSDETLKRTAEIRRRILAGESLQNLPSFKDPHLEELGRRKFNAMLHKARGHARDAVAAGKTIEEYMRATGIKIPPHVLRELRKELAAAGSLEEDAPSGVSDTALHKKKKKDKDAGASGDAGTSDVHGKISKKKRHGKHSEE